MSNEMDACREVQATSFRLLRSRSTDPQRRNLPINLVELGLVRR
jgi:hypothetical protein